MRADHLPADVLLDDFFAEPQHPVRHRVVAGHEALAHLIEEVATVQPELVAHIRDRAGQEAHAGHALVLARELVEALLDAGPARKPAHAHRQVRERALRLDHGKVP
ncbi:hypothetical protein D3C86_1901690 [compost metagenome]